MAALEQTCASLPTPQAAWFHQTHPAGGLSGFTTMVIVWTILKVFPFGTMYHFGTILKFDADNTS